MKFFETKHDDGIPVRFVKHSKFDAWLSSKPDSLKNKIELTGFDGKTNSVLIDLNAKGQIKQIFVGITEKHSIFDASNLVEKLRSTLSEKILNSVCFSPKGIRAQRDLNFFYLGWALSCYEYSLKTTKSIKAFPRLCVPNAQALKYATNLFSGIQACRDLINTPPNLLGPENLEKQILELTADLKPKTEIIRDKDLLKKNFPMIYAVGKGSPDRPRLIVLEWGKKTDPKVSLVGKGITFDTGGLNIKPDQAMDLMKKDMGGAAHALGLSIALMKAKTPINLKLYLPIAENSIDGDCFRPSDVLTSRKGLTVEIGNTDCEGRLVCADALTYASEQNPELIIDYTTLTGHARVAVGWDLAPVFCNNKKIQDRLVDISMDIEDEMWPQPLWNKYFNEIQGKTGDLNNKGVGSRAGHIHAALFLQEFIDKSIDWVHFDLYGWSQTGRAGRPWGGTDQCIRAMFHYLTERYA